MATEVVKGEIENAYGQPVPADKRPVKYEGTFETFDNYADIPTKDMPTEKDILAYVNNARKANARQKFMAEALERAGIVKPDPNSAEQIEKTLVNTYLKAGLPEEMAKQFAAQAMKQAQAIKAQQTVNA